MPHAFYSNSEYRERQSRIAKTNWAAGVYSSRTIPLETRICKNNDCNNSFAAKPSDPKIYCSHKCSAHITNFGRKQTLSTRLKISKAILLLPKSHFQRRSLPKIILKCIFCARSFGVQPYLSKKRKYCSIHCSIRAIGSMTTSPKASKGKPGIRADIDQNVCFYSTWEANVARVFNLIGLKWVYAPKLFDLGEHTYRPDFYLPDFNMFIEVKNFMGEYSLERHKLFKRKYPNIKLELLMKNEYIQIKDNYKHFISNWEY